MSVLSATLAQSVRIACLDTRQTVLCARTLMNVSVTRAARKASNRARQCLLRTQGPLQTAAVQLVMNSQRQNVGAPGGTAVRSARRHTVQQREIRTTVLLSHW